MRMQEGTLIEVVYEQETYLCQIKKINPKVIAEVDGGINKDTVKIAKENGADAFVAGNALFGAADIKQAYKDLKDAIN